MHVFCCIKSCGLSRHRNKMRMFAFPRANSLIDRIWREKCNIPPETSNIPEEIYYKRPHICERHFDKKDIGIKFLKRNAIPKYFLNETTSGNANENDQAVNEDDNTYDWKSLEEIPPKENTPQEKKEESPKQVIETVIQTVEETVIVEHCDNCEKKEALSLSYEKKCHTLAIENYQLRIQLEARNKMLEKTEHSSDCLRIVEQLIQYKAKYAKLSVERLRLKRQARDLLRDSLRNIERSKYYEKKCDALKKKYEKIVNQLEEQLKQQSEIINTRNCLPESTNNPEVTSANLSNSQVNADLITEPMLLDNQPSSESSRNLVSESLQEEVVDTNYSKFTYHDEYVAPETSSNEIIAINNHNDGVRLLMENEIKDEVDEIEESDSEVDFNFNYDYALLSPSSIKQEEEFLLE